MHKISAPVVAERLIRNLREKKAVLLDLDNTLYAYGPCHAAGLRGAHAAFCSTVKRISRGKFLARYEGAKKTVHGRLAGQASSHSRLLYFQTMLESTAGRTDFRNGPNLEHAYWNAFLAAMRRRSWVLPFLRECRRRGVRVVLVTNLTAGIQHRKVRRLGIGRFVDALVSSEEAGAEKPDPRIFRLACLKAGCGPSRALSVGDERGLDRCPGSVFFKI